jgi:CheY-like chemotaxis protein
MNTLAEQRPLRVLIVDSDNVRRGMLACTLPATSFSLEFARSAEKGLDLLGQLQPDVVIVGRDGSSTDTCRRVRSLPAGQTCTLMVMDEQYRNESIGEADAEAAGADSFLPFPFETALLEKRLETHHRTRVTAPTVLAAAEQSSQPTPSPTSTPTPASALENIQRAWEQFRERVESLHGALDKLDYCQLLSIQRQSGPSEIKDAYFKCSMELHPDRFMQLQDEELKRKIYDIYKRMSEAFKVLINPELRSSYEADLDGSDGRRNLRFLDRGRRPVSLEDPTADAVTPPGKRYLHFANLALNDGNLRSARMYLTLALQCEAQNDALRARLEDITRRLDT